MKILALELSTARGSLTWLDGEVEDGHEWPNDRKNSAPFFENLNAVRRKLGDPRRLTVDFGPGRSAGPALAVRAPIGCEPLSAGALTGCLPSAAFPCKA